MQEYIVYGAADDIRHERLEAWIAKQGGKLACYLDNNSVKWGGDIRSPKEALKYPEAKIIIDCFPVRTVAAALRSLGATNELLVYPLLGFYFYIDDDIDDRLAWTKQHEAEIRDLYDLSDEETAATLTETLSERLLPELELLPYERLARFEPPKDMYFFDENLNPDGDITFVDGGAFIGDSIMPIARRLGSRLRQVYAFEPDSGNMARMKENLGKALPKGQDIAYVPAGMHDCVGELRFSSGKDWSKIDEQGDIVVPVTTLDEVVRQVTGKLCIKMDIEGSELAALRGGERLIREQRPYLAICLYHRMRDLLEVPQLIKAFGGEYRFYLRCGFHTICYAVPV